MARRRQSASPRRRQLLNRNLSVVHRIHSNPAVPEQGHAQQRNAVRLQHQRVARASMPGHWPKVDLKLKELSVGQLKGPLTYGGQPQLAFPRAIPIF